MTDTINTRELIDDVVILDAVFHGSLADPFS